MKKLVKYNELFWKTDDSDPTRPAVLEKSEKKPPINYEVDKEFVDDIKQIFMPLIDDGFVFRYTFRRLGGSYNFVLMVTLLDDDDEDFGGAEYTIGSDEITRRNQNETDMQKFIEDNKILLESKLKYGKSLLENVSEINDRLEDYKEKWEIHVMLNVNFCTFEVDMYDKRVQKKVAYR